jgi:hypothetical protein
MLTLPPFSELARGTPAAAVRTLMRRFPPTSLALGSDIEALAELFLRVTGASEVRLHLEHVADDACRCHHVDAVRLRMLCTYAGPGTEWLDSWSRTHRMAVMQVGIFKGTPFPNNGLRVLHRSPPVSELPRRRRPFRLGSSSASCSSSPTVPDPPLHRSARSVLRDILS